MRKKFLGAFLLGVFTIAATSTFVSCKDNDYDDDIAALRQDVNSIQSTLGTIQTAFNQGVVVTEVKQDGTGIVLTTSDGNTYRVSNGANGTNADVWSIDETTGYWMKNGVLTNLRAVGIDGKDGKDGVDGKDGKDGVDGKDGKDGVDGKDGKDGKDATSGSGTDGKDGKDGKDGADGKDAPTVYYMPGDDGYFVKVTITGTETKEEKTDIAWTSASSSKKTSSRLDELNAEATDGVSYFIKLNETTGFFEIWKDDNGTKSLVETMQEKWLTSNTLTAVQDANYVRFYNVLNSDGSYSTISIPTKLELKSLVFDPQMYYEGIQAFEISTISYKALTVAAVTANGKHQADAPTVGSQIEFTPDLEATYHLNPSNAYVLEDAKHYKFVAYDMPYTRAARTNTSNNFNIYKATVKNGKVTVKANFSGNSIKDIATEDQVSVLALQYNTGDTVITSDYAAIRANKYTDIHLNLTTKAKGVTTHNKDYVIPSHMYEKAADAIANAAQIEVRWDNNDGIDLRKYVQSCRSYSTYSGSATTVDKLWDTPDAVNPQSKESGFKYSFQLVGYETGASATKQSTHAAIKDDGYTLRPQMPKADGNQAEYGAEQNQAEVGREPLVRVLLTDTVHNKIAAVGYVKVKIIPSDDPLPDDDTAEFIDINPLTDAYTIACGDGNFRTLTLKWNDIENQILAKLNMPKSYFHEMYELDGVTSDGVAATQYNDIKTTSTPVTTPFGKVTITTDSQDGTATDTKVLTWTIRNQEAYLAQKSGTPTTKTAIVCFRPATGKTPVPTYFYVRFTWTPSAVNIKPETAFGDENKIKMYWYTDNSTTAGSGYKEIHGSVETVGTDVAILNPATLDKADTYANDEFVFDIRNTLVGHKLSVDALASPYNALTSIDNTFSFVTGNGLYANANGTQLYAESTLTNLVATIDPISGVVRYETSTKALQLLNKADHTDLANSVTATVNVKSVACSGTPSGVSNIPVTVKNNAFNVKFLRPIDVTEGQAHFEDAATGGDDAPVELTFVDWRNHNFTNISVTKGFDYFAYYGIRNIDVKIAQATTDLNGTYKSLKSVAPNFQLTYTAPTYYPASADPNGYTRPGNFVRKSEYGTLHYDNNGSTMGDAHVKIPVVITYDWGQVQGEIICSFDKTQANVKKH